MPCDTDAYGRFLAAHSRDAAVSPAAARGSGIDSDGFDRISEAGLVVGELVLKVWGGGKHGRLLWCYVGNPRGGCCFPLFPSTGPYAAATTCPLGTAVQAFFEKETPGGPWCSSFRSVSGGNEGDAYE